MDTGDQLLILARLALAAFLGAFIGLERELRGYPAGVRTVALVALGSALFTEVSRLMGSEDRIAAGIVSGIGFLGAGAIIRHGVSVRGLTTAASLWAVAAVGLAAGLGSLLIFLLLEARPVVRRLDNIVGARLRGLAAREEEEREEAEQARGRDE